MAREYRVITALGPTAVPVPATFGLCEDPDVNGQPFYVMEFVDGHIIRDARAAEHDLDDKARRRAGESLADTLAALHAVDVDAVGLGDFAKRDGYIERQLRRWYEQFRNSQVEGLDTATIVGAVHDRLAAQVPPQVGTSIVHGDYRLDNTVLGPDGEVRAVLDWEICTLGDPLADVGLLMVYWTDPGDEAALLGVTPTTVPGFPSRAEMRGRYAAASGRDLEAPRLLRRLRLLEAGLHPPGRLRALRRRRGGRRPLERGRLRPQRRQAGRDGARRAGARVSAGRSDMTLYERHVGAHPRPSRAGRGARRMGRRRARRRRRHHRAVVGRPDRARRHLRRRGAHRPARPAAGGAHLPRGQRGAHVAGHPAAGGDRSSRRRRLLPGRARAGLPVAHVRRLGGDAGATSSASAWWWGWVPSPPRPPTPGPCAWRRPRPRESAELVARVGIVQGEIDVPSGVWGALEIAFGEAGIPTVGLWARVPHYVSGMAFPSASAALLDGLAAVGRAVAGLDRPAHRRRRLAPAGRRPHRQERRAHLDGAPARAQRRRGRGQPPRRGDAADRRGARRRARTLPTRRTQRRRARRRHLSAPLARHGAEPSHYRLRPLLHGHEVDDEHERLVGRDGRG